MSDGMPRFTMTLSRQIDEQPFELNQKQSMLFNTLKTLCSFHTAEDLGHFLFSDSFKEITAQKDPWLVFEIGIYEDHTKTVELVPTEVITIADAKSSGAFDDNLAILSSMKDVVEAIDKWYNLVFEEANRYR